MAEAHAAHWADGADAPEKGLPAGSYWFQPGGEFHNDACRGEADCRVFVFMPKAPDLLPKGAM